MILHQCLPNLGMDLLSEIESHSPIRKFEKEEFVVKQSQVIRFLPIVLKGSIKVFSNEETMQFLLYYIAAGETCIFSFAHIFNEEPIGFSATAEIESELILLPIHKVKEWFIKYPRFSHMLLNGYQKHYDDLLRTTKEVICYNLEDRLLTYLKRKTQIEDSHTLTISHQEIANDLGTSREVITRLIKKLSVKDEVIQLGRKIKVQRSDKSH